LTSRHPFAAFVLPLTVPNVRGMVRALFLLLALLTVGFPASADADDPRLDRLFAQLREARTDGEIASLMSQIGGIWQSSGSEALDLLMARAGEAMEKGAPDIAFELYDKIVDLAPRYAEGWRRRGALQAAEGNGDEALSDLREALQLEPRHFGALNDVARLLEAEGDVRGALEALRRLSEIIPYAEGMRQRILKLEDAVKAQRDPI
jgi:tetratricopeptide (TPR) repeat protein